MGDRHAAFASVDRAASGRMAEEFPPSKCGERLHIVDGRDALDGLIRDSGCAASGTASQPGGRRAERRGAGKGESEEKARGRRPPPGRQGPSLL